ncbi:nucleoside triphosphatase YtkD [Sporolactobacillus shoreae]|uniref:Nucleoside triphosphatase YtkD n=1 Tax=Sporolactobacillus shoreae TaxID=1465501 RepID=A0A4Z0GR77_9BACL|nr:nucleoside triphosphatase YtkD [Sporolactobacillus shoreae]TGA99294.1 nucleoside triphosphatase YtkD [Sporolactobacillus shoreae]
METFQDYYGNQVRLSLQDTPFSDRPKHVWVVCHFHRQWLLTRHSRRGFEFPGGKVEQGETAEDAAKREVFEETGGRVASLFLLGQYEVSGRNEQIVKNIYYAEIDRMDLKEDYLETKGPVFINRIPEKIQTDKRFSFLMKDRVLASAMDAIRIRRLDTSGLENTAK